MIDSGIYVFVIEQRQGNGELLDDGLFREQPTREFSYRHFTSMVNSGIDCISDRRDDQGLARQWGTPPGWREWTDCNLFLHDRAMVWQW
jgi:hypothetical protein